MEALDKLKQIGIKRINQDTKISVGMIENILEKRFDKIQRVWIVGFLPIIEREYQVDLSSWLEEYNTFLIQNSQDQELSSSAYKIRELELDTQKQRYDKYGKNKLRIKVWYIILVLVIVVLFVAYKFFIKSERMDYLDHTNISSSFSQQEEQKHLDSDGSIYTQLSIQEVNHQEKNTSGIYGALESGVMAIEPKREVWFQIWNLQTNAKQEKIIKEPYHTKIPQQKSLIVFGHRSFKLRYGNEIKDYEGGDAIRFVCENGKIEPIRYADYAKLVQATKKKFEVIEETKTQGKKVSQENIARKSQAEDTAKENQDTKEIQNTQEIKEKNTTEEVENTKEEVEEMQEEVISLQKDE